MATILETEGNADNESVEIAKHLMQSNIDFTNITIDQLLIALKEFLTLNPTMVAIDCQNEALYYNSNMGRSPSGVIGKYGIDKENSANSTRRSIEPNDGNEILKENLKQTIETYEKLLYNKQKKGEDTRNIKQLIDTLKIQLESCYTKKKKANTEEPLRIIFDFYSNQRFTKNKMSNEEENRRQQLMPFGYFAKMLSDFNIHIENYVEIL